MEVTDKTVSLINSATQQKLINCVSASGLSVSPDALLNTLIDDEIERQRLLKISAEIAEEEREPMAPSQKIANICNQHLSTLNHESESFAIRAAIENLYNDLLQQNLIFVNAREGSIIESKRLETSRVAYYWYAGTLAKHRGGHYESALYV